ncbi:glycoside hydrolase family 3 N-terminal domain-containing protein [Novosphingobium sp. 11B]
MKRMTLEEKAGTVMHSSFPEIGTERGVSSVGYDLETLSPVVLQEGVTSFLTRLAVPPKTMAIQNNAAQEIAERGRLGIPLTVSTDPRHHFLYITGQSSASAGYSRWPETLGFAATGDTKLVREFANIARREYRATGIQQALSPQVDLYSEPRWARGYGGFGADARLSRDMAFAYVAGFQGSANGLQGDGVLATIKHWVAYGATVNGLDAHNSYGKRSRVNARSFKLQIEPFLGGFAARVGAVMPTYSIVEGVKVDGRPLEPVAAGYSRQLLNDLLRDKYHFGGIILSDWAITNDCPLACFNPSAANPQGRATLGMPWGVETLTRRQRFTKAMMAGVDQFGGVAEPQQIVAAVQAGDIPVERLDQAVSRILEAKFVMGLFENPFVDPVKADAVVNTPQTRTIALRAQAEAQVLLKDKGGILPLKPGKRVFASGVSADALRAAGLVPVSDTAQAEVALVRVDAPYETLHPYNFIGARQHEGRLDFAPDNTQAQEVRTLSKQLPVIASVFLDRPAVLGSLDGDASVVLANFGIADDALLAALTGRIAPRGRLPFELPSSMDAVDKQDPAMPNDSERPLYRMGSGIVR